MALSIHVQDYRAFAVFSIYKYINIIAVLLCTIRFYRKVSKRSLMILDKSFPEG